MTVLGMFLLLKRCKGDVDFRRRDDHKAGLEESRPMVVGAIVRTASSPVGLDIRWVGVWIKLETPSVVVEDK